MVAPSNTAPCPSPSPQIHKRAHGGRWRFSLPHPPSANSLRAKRGQNCPPTPPARTTSSSRKTISGIRPLRTNATKRTRLLKNGTASRSSEKRASPYIILSNTGVMLNSASSMSKTISWISVSKNSQNAFRLMSCGHLLLSMSQPANSASKICW